LYGLNASIASTVCCRAPSIAAKYERKKRRTLHRLNNVEKHRLLLTVGSQAGGVNISQDMARHMAVSGFQPEAIAACESMGIFVNPEDTGFPLKAGFELFIAAVDEKPNPKQQFRFSVALNEPGIIEGKPLVETLHQLAGVVDNVITALTPLFA
jgi:hypothetical protein